MRQFFILGLSNPLIYLDEQNYVIFFFFQDFLINAK